jgi:A/G-specific adenine glycosylase
MKRVSAGMPGISIMPAADEKSVAGLADPTFSEAVIRWQKQHGRHALPWQNTRDAYRIWLSEIMLQQTQVAAVIPYYQRFLERFPDVGTLAEAPVEEIMAHWSGLGYYSRARNLHRCAQRICTDYGGAFPADPDLLAQLPGIGRSTAAAIAAFSYGTRAAILDGNVKRVFCRIFGVEGYPGEKKIETALWRHADALLPDRDVEAYTQGLMDLGATLCTRSNPSCTRCPMMQRCKAFETDRTKHLPAKKPKKTIPVKHTAMLIMIDHNQVLLEQRPPAGIWGGLLSLPEVGNSVSGKADASGEILPDAVIADAVRRFGTMASCEPLPVVTHVFSHFKLHISPFRIALDRRLDAIGQGSHIWYDTAKLSRAALPAPIKKLLLHVCGGSGQTENE